MPFKLNVFTGTLDIVNKPPEDLVGVLRVGPTNDRRIAIWAGNSVDAIQNSKASVQQGGAVVAQAHITNKIITDTVRIESNHVMVTSGFSIEPDGELIIEADGELVVV